MAVPARQKIRIGIASAVVLFTCFSPCWSKVVETEDSHENNDWENESVCRWYWYCVRDLLIN